MTETIDISVVIPIYRNNRSLIELSERIMKNLNLFNYEIIFVNDSSPDNSLLTLEMLTSKHKQIRHINLVKNIGQQKATLEGLKKALGEKIAVLDGDLQDIPELISVLHESILSNKHAAFVKRKGVYQSKGRMITSVLIKKIVQLLSGLHYKAGSYYMFDKVILSKVVFIGSKCPYPYLSIIVAHFAQSVIYVPSTRNKNVGPSGYNFTKRIKAALMAIYCSLYCTYSKLILD